LAAGKGALVCQSIDDAHEAVEDVMVQKQFGEAGRQVVIEECLVGEEVSMLALTDGRSLYLMPPSQDHKAIYDGDQGPNTGGWAPIRRCPL
jgi:phosphoribosylamine--glycine ligase